jgi:hypothetical protein
MRISKEYWLLCCLILVSLQNVAQTKTTDEFSRWTLNFSVGKSLFSPSKEDFLNGLPNQAISTYNTHIPWYIELSRSLDESLALSISIDKIGYRGIFFDIPHDFKTIGLTPAVNYNFKNIFDVGLGPSIYVIKQKPHYTTHSTKNQTSKFGFEIKAALTLIDVQEIIWQLNAKYCFIDKENNFEMADQDAPQYKQFIYYPKVNMSYAYIGVNLGFRIK